METIIVTLQNGKKLEYKKGIKLYEVLENLKNDLPFDILIAKYRNEFINYNDSLTKNGTLELFDINTSLGNRTYERALTIVFKTAVYEVLGPDTKVIVRHSLDKGIYIDIDKKITKDKLELIKVVMKDKIAKKIPFTKIETTIQEATEYFKNIKRKDLVKTLFYNKSNYITLYKFENTYHYVLGLLPNDSGVLKYFDLTLLEGKGIVLRYPSIYNNGKIVKYTHHDNLFNSLEEYAEWGRILNINNLGDLNDSIVNTKPGELINLSESIQDYKLLKIAETIKQKSKDIKIVLMSGPSSSGKTTTARKLSLYLKTLGLNPIALSLDDYFLDREETPLDENGNYDFESLRAIDTKLFNNQISKMLKGSKVITPTFDFVKGKKTFKNAIKLEEKDILIIEGLHCLNDALLESIPRKNKYKIYISPLPFLNIDNDNRISMTDLRLLRRMVRDNRVRGYSPSQTLKSWSDVRKGEEKYIFPFQDEADTIFNSTLAYELAVLKTYAEPLLFTVQEDDPEYDTALRLLQLLKFVLPMPSQDVPSVSILREFIGGSYFER